MVLLVVFSIFHGAEDNFLCCGPSPSIQYSIFRKTISMKIVWGHIQPQNNRPQITVKRTMNKTKVIIASTKRWKSCGIKTMPKRIKCLSSTLNNINGCPSYLKKGPINKRAINTQAR